MPNIAGLMRRTLLERPDIRFAGNVTVEQATPGPLPLSLDDAIDRGLKQNLQVLLAGQTEQSVRGQILAVFYYLLPNLKATAYTNAEEINLAALGFKPSSLAAFGFPPGQIHDDRESGYDRCAVERGPGAVQPARFLSVSRRPRRPRTSSR